MSQKPLVIHIDTATGVINTSAAARRILIDHSAALQRHLDLPEETDSPEERGLIEAYRTGNVDWILRLLRERGMVL